MTTQKIEVAHEPLVKQKFNWLLAIGIFIVGLGLGAFVTTLPIAKTEIGAQNVAGPLVRDVPARPDLAEPAAPTYSRGPTLAEYTAAIEENKANVQRAIEAEAARYNGLDKFYGAKDGVSLDENALATYHQSERDFTSIVTSRIEENAVDAYHQSEWGLTPSAVLPSEADALAVYHQSERDFTPIVTSRTEENSLDAYHQSEWGLTPSAVLPSEADALAAYHQSEWGRPLSLVLPIAKNETDAEQDLGLMEFFTVPDETSRQRTEPGTLEALPTIDPADRKFFSPGYGASSGGSKEAEVLPTIDPADRKFFSPNYGAQTISANGSEAILPHRK